MAHPILLAGAAVALFGAFSVQGAVGGRAEVMAGAAPVVPSEPARPAVAVELLPGAAVLLQTPRSKLESSYTLRLFHREPNRLELDRPLFLHRAKLSHGVRLDERLSLESRVTGSIGEVDYTETSAVFDPAQASQLETAVIDFYDAQAELRLDAKLDPRSGFSGAALFGRTAPLQAETGLPVHTRAGVAAEYDYRLTRRDDAELPVLVEHHTIDTEQLVAVSAEIGWRRRISRRTSLAAAAGGLHAEPVAGEAEQRFLPTARTSVEHAFRRRRSLRWNGSATLSLRAALDVLRAEYRPTAGVEAATELLLLPSWTAAARAALYTAATEQPLGSGEPETTFLAEAPIVFSATRDLSLEAGVRTGFRAPHWSERFQAEQLQFWIYAALTVAFGSSRQSTLRPDSAR